jgi:hypothetical protein
MFLTSKFSPLLLSIPNDATKRACEREYEPMSRIGYFWNILMMGTEYFKNISMSRRNDVENIFSHVHG